MWEWFDDASPGHATGPNKGPVIFRALPKGADDGGSGATETLLVTFDFAKGRLAQTAGLTEVQIEILAAVKSFVDKEILPHATELEGAAGAFVEQQVAAHLVRMLFGQPAGAASPAPTRRPNAKPSRTPTSHSPPSRCPAGQPTEISSNGSTTPANNPPDYVAGTEAPPCPTSETHQPAT